MIQYSNIAGDSKIIGYDEGQDYIIVHFINGDSYTYSFDTAGEYNVQQMKLLASQGEGLNSYINQNVKYSYESY